MVADPAAAMALIASPSRWLSRLQDRDSDGVERRWLVLRCYMNPAGSLPHPTNPGERLYFSKYRPFFTQAGVEVVDCPALTKGSKNGADIRMVIDMMSALKSSTRYDEFVIASADSDFTPLLHVLRADDRRITVMATSTTAIAYESLADRFLDERDIFDLMVDEVESDADLTDEEFGPGQELQPPATAVDSGESTDSSTFEQFRAAVHEIYSKAEEPINLSRLATDLKSLSTGNWFDHGTFVRAIQSLDLPQAKISHHRLWDQTRHREPVAPSRPDLPDAVAHISEVTGLPSLESGEWPRVFELLAAYAARRRFNYLESSKWCRDQAVEEGHEISRRVFSFVIRASRDGGANLNSATPPDAAGIVKALYMSLLRQAETAGLDVSEQERIDLAAWLHLEDVRG